MGGLAVVGELAEIGYDAEWRVVSAAGLGAPHRRDRVFILAYAEGRTGRRSKSHGIRTIYGQAAELRESFSASRPDAYWWETEPDVGRVAHGIPARVDRLRGLGNAVVPQVAEYIGRLVIAHDR